jgi:hypothetical protein
MSARKPEFSRSDEPPVIVRVPRLTVVRPGRAVKFAICSDRIWGIHTHWDPQARRTIECVTPHKLCQGHARQLPLRWKGVITVLESGSSKPLLLDLPPEAGVSLQEQSGGQSLRGRMILCQRETANIRSRLLIELLDMMPNIENLKPEEDPTPTLRKIWGLG